MIRPKLFQNFPTRQTRQMDDDETPKPKPQRQRSSEAVENASLALRERLLWPIEDGLLEITERGHDAVSDRSRRPRTAVLVGGAAALILAVAVAALALGGSSESEPLSPSPVVVVNQSSVEPAPIEKQAKPDPTLQGATPVFKAKQAQQAAPEPKQAENSARQASAVAAANTGNPATDTITSTPAARPTEAAAASAVSPDGPPAGPAAVAVARKFAGAFVVYETGGDATTVRKAFEATATPRVTKALLQRPPRQPAGVEVPKAKVLNVVPAPSHDRIYPVSVSLLRVGATSELRLEMEQLKNKQWQVVNVLG